MRLFIAMTFAFMAAGYATIAVGPMIADNAVSSWRFEDPSEVSSTHAAIFLLTCILALLAGWAVGWLLGFPFGRRRG